MARKGEKTGKYYGGGMPKGHVTQKVLDREEGKRRLQEKVLARIDPLVEAMFSRALGINHFMLRDPDNGQWIRVEDPDQIVAALNHPKAEAGSTYMIHVKDPDVQAAKDLFDRALGKATEELKVDAKVKTVIEWQK